MSTARLPAPGPAFPQMISTPTRERRSRSSTVVALRTEDPLTFTSPRPSRATGRHGHTVGCLFPRPRHSLTPDAPIYDRRRCTTTVDTFAMRSTRSLARDRTRSGTVGTIVFPPRSKARFPRETLAIMNYNNKASSMRKQKYDTRDLSGQDKFFVRIP